MASKKSPESTSSTGKTQATTKAAPKKAADAVIKGKGTVVTAESKAPVVTKSEDAIVKAPSHPMQPNYNTDATLTAREAGRIAARHGYSPSVRLRQVEADSDADTQWMEGFNEVANPRSTGRVEDIKDGYRKDY